MKCSCWFCQPGRESRVVSRDQSESNMEFRWRLARMGKILWVDNERGEVVLKSALVTVAR